jgi:hypothetical protein
MSGPNWGEVGTEYGVRKGRSSVQVGWPWKAKRDVPVLSVLGCLVAWMLGYETAGTTTPQLSLQQSIQSL